MPFYMKTNDTSPAIEAVLKDGNGAVVSLIGASVSFHMRAIGVSDAKVSSSATISDAANGVVYYQWQPSDTSEVGSYEGEFEVTYTGGEKETFPNNRNIEIEFTEDLG